MYCKDCGKELKEGEACTCQAVSPQTVPSEELPGEAVLQAGEATQPTAPAIIAEQPPEAPPVFEIPPAPQYQPPYQGEDTNPTYQEPQYQQPYGAAPQPQPYGVNPYTAPATPVIEILRRHGSSSLMLALVILLGVGIIVSGFALFFSPNFDTYYQMGSDTYYYGDFDYYSDPQLAAGLAVVRASTSFFFSVPMILMFVGVLLFYLGCRNPKTPFVSKGGLTMVQVMSIISFSLMILMLVLLGVVLLAMGPLMTTYLNDYGSAPAGVAGMVVAILGICVFVAIGIISLYYIPLFRVLSAVKAHATTGMAVKRISMFFIVMLFIMGGFSALGVLGSFASPYSLISGLINTAISVIGGIVLLRYRNEINLFLNTYRPY